MILKLQDTGRVDEHSKSTYPEQASSAQLCGFHSQLLSRSSVLSRSICLSGCCHVTLYTPVASQ